MFLKIKLFRGDLTFKIFFLRPRIRISNLDSDPEDPSIRIQKTPESGSLTLPGAQVLHCHIVQVVNGEEVGQNSEDDSSRKKNNKRKRRNADDKLEEISKSFMRYKNILFINDYVELFI